MKKFLFHTFAFIFLINTHVFGSALHEAELIDIEFPVMTDESSLNSGIHVYRLEYHKNQQSHHETAKANSHEEDDLCTRLQSMTIVGCNHAISKEIFSSTHEEALSRAFNETKLLLSERVDDHIDVKIRGYVQILYDLYLQPTLLEVDFFNNFTRKRWGANYNETQPQIVTAFTRFIQLIHLSPFRENLEIPLSQSILINLAHFYSDPDKARRLPQRLIYDFVYMIVKKNAFEHQLIDVARGAVPFSTNPNIDLPFRNALPKRILSLDREEPLPQNEQRIFQVPIDFSSLTSDVLQRQIFNFYEEPYAWMFQGEEPIYEIIPKTLLDQLKTLCDITKESQKMACHFLSTYDAVNARAAFTQDRTNIAARQAYKDNPDKSDVIDYFLGLWSYSDNDVAERNYAWLQSTLKVAFEEDHTSPFLMMGLAHLRGVQKNNHRGILDFFIDLQFQKNFGYWLARLGSDNFNFWRTITITGLKRMTSSGEYVDLFKQSKIN